jgi:hypothetical protein
MKKLIIEIVTEDRLIEIIKKSSSFENFLDGVNSVDAEYKIIEEEIK